MGMVKNSIGDSFSEIEQAFHLLGALRLYFPDDGGTVRIYRENEMD